MQYATGQTPDDTVCQKLPNFNSMQVAIADSDIRHTIAFSFMLYYNNSSVHGATLYWALTC